MKEFYVYILKCRDDSLYTGYTVNLNNRIRTHNRGKASKYTRGRLPVSLIYYESYATKGEALKRECAIKKLSREKKLQLVSKKIGGSLWMIFFQF